MERVREERKGTGLTLDLGDEHVHEAALDAQSGGPRRLGDRAAKLVRRHRAEQDLVPRDGFGQPGVGGAASVEVRPQRDRYGLFAREQAVDEARAQLVVVAEREDLLELVDDQQPAGLGDRGALAGRDGLARAERGQHAGPQHRGLAAAGAADDRDEAPLAQAGDQGGGELLAAEEQLAIVALEGEQAGIGALGRRLRRANTRRGEREDVLGLAHAAQPVGTEIDEGLSLIHI